MYGNWGGSNWSGGQSGSDIPASPLPPVDALDSCYMQHDYCYAAAQKNAKNSCNNKDLKSSISDCDHELASCVLKVPDGTGGAWGGFMGPSSGLWAVFKGGSGDSY